MARPFLDSCIVIYYVELEPVLAPRIGAALSAFGADSRAVVSDLVRLECRVGPRRAADDRLLARYDAFFARDQLVTAPLNATTFDLATDLRARHGLKTADALHLATAIQSGCDEFWTRDRRLAPAAGTHLRVVTFDQAP